MRSFLLVGSILAGSLAAAPINTSIYGTIITMTQGFTQSGNTQPVTSTQSYLTATLFYTDLTNVTSADVAPPGGGPLAMTQAIPTNQQRFDYSSPVYSTFSAFYAAY